MPSEMMASPVWLPLHTKKKPLILELAKLFHQELNISAEVFLS